MVMVTFPANPDRRLSAPSSASMNSSAFFSAASEMPGGSPANAGILPSLIVPPPIFLVFGVSPQVKLTRHRRPEHPTNVSVAGSAIVVPGSGIVRTRRHNDYASPAAFLPSAACAAARRAIGTRNGEHDT